MPLVAYPVFGSYVICTDKEVVGAGESLLDASKDVVEQHPELSDSLENISIYAKK